MAIQELHVSTKPAKKIYRSEEKQVVAGVATGLGDYLNADPNAFRVLFSLLALIFGLGLAAYLIFWILLPPKSKINQDELRVILSNIQEIRTRLLPKTSRQKEDDKLKTFLSIAVMVAGIAAIVLSFTFLTGLLGPGAVIAFLAMATVFAVAVVLIK